jgi:hypothetical protein
MNDARRLLLAFLAILVALQMAPRGSLPPATSAEPEKLPDPRALIAAAVKELVQMQEDGGQWPYEGVYRVNRQIPVGYRIGGTAIAATALLFAAPNDPAAVSAVDKALSFVLKELDDPLMTPSVENTYDVRIWGQAYALEFLCHIRAAKRARTHDMAVDEWIAKLISVLVAEEIAGGGWNYASHSRHASFVTAPVTQALLFAQGQGEAVPAEVLERARIALTDSRAETGAFVYAGKVRPNADTRLPGSAARSAACEATLYLLGAGSQEAIRSSVDAFATHWEELAKRRRKPGTHEGEYNIAPYYFYYGHRYAAQAIELLPPDKRPAERERLLRIILKTREDDGTWNDRIFPRSRNYGTAAIVLALLGEHTPMPEKWTKR